MADDPQIDDSQPPDLGGAVNAVGVLLKDGFGVGGDMTWLINNGVQWVVVVLGVILRAITRVVAMVAKAFQTLLEQDNPELGRLAVSILGAMFGRSIADTIPGSILNPGNLDENAEAVGGSVLAAVFGSVTGGGVALQPSLVGAERYLGAVTNLCTRGFILDMIEQFFPEPFRFSFVHHLEDDLINGLGLGRVARQVLQPIVHATIQTPALWAVNLAYRPTLANEATAIGMWMRGAIDDAELDDILGRKGYGPDTIEALKIEHAKHPGVGELATLYGHAVLADDEIVPRLQRAGYDQQAATEIWEATKLHHFESWAVREAEIWLERYTRGFVTAENFEKNLRALPLFPGVADLLVAQAAARLSSPHALLSVTDLFSAWDNQVITQNAVHDYLIRLGYSDDDATILLLNRLAIGKHKTELADEKAKAQAARAAAIAAAKLQRAADQAAAKAAAAAERAAKATALAQQKAQRLTDVEARRQFLAQAAEQKRQLVAGAHAANQITADQAQAAQAQITADLQELNDLAAAQIAEADATFAQEVLDLRQQDREATLQQQLDDIDLMLEPIAAARSAAVAQRIQDVQTTLSQKLADLDTLYADKAAATRDNLANAQSAVDVETLPTKEERAAVAAAKQADLDATLARKLADLTAEFDDKQAAIDSELAAGTISAKAAQTKTDAVTTGRAEKARAAQQAHDLASQAVTTAESAAVALTLVAATTAKTKLETAAAAAATTLATTKVAAQLAARQAADKETLALHAIAAQIAPVTAAEAARRRLQVNEQNAAAKRNEQVVAVEIAKGKADADAKAAALTATAGAARARLTAIQSAAGARERATTAQESAAAALAAQQEAAREALERTIAAHELANLSVNPTPQ